MMTKDLKTKAVSLGKKGKYVLVKDRVIYFNETYPNGYINTSLLSGVESDTVVVRAHVVPDADKPNRYFTGYSQEVKGEGMVNKTSAMENAETSAVGRALAMMGIGVIDSIASVDEIRKAENRSARQIDQRQKTMLDDCLSYYDEPKTVKWLEKQADNLSRYGKLLDSAVEALENLHKQISNYEK